MTNPISIVINRPLPGPNSTVRLRHKGKPHMMEDGSVGLTCLDEDNRKYWVAITPLMLSWMTQIYKERT